MPASLDEAFTKTYSSNSDTMTSLSSLKNPNHHGFQTDYRVKNLNDIQSEADEITSVYNSLQTLHQQQPVNKYQFQPQHNQSQNQSQNQFKNMDNQFLNLNKNQNHDCNLLISKLLSCQKCRSKIKEILSDDGSTVDENNDKDRNKSQSGGAGGKSFLGVTKTLCINIAFGILLILILDGLFNIKK
jgi:hypothetical protein